MLFLLSLFFISHLFCSDNEDLNCLSLIEIPNIVKGSSANDRLQETKSYRSILPTLVSDANIQIKKGNSKIWLLQEKVNKMQKALDSKDKQQISLEKNLQQQEEKLKESRLNYQRLTKNLIQD